MKISVCIVATNRYKELLPSIILDVLNFFLPNHSRTIHIFSDEKYPYDRVGAATKLISYKIPAHTFPSATLLRYHFMTSVPQEEYGDYIFYIDADSKIISEIGEEILAPIVAVRHPGYFRKGGGSWGNIKESLSYTKPEKRTKYFCGGIAGGSNDHYYAIMRLLKEQIDIDIKNDVKNEWQDETFWNKYLSETGGFLELDCRYMMPEPMSKRVAWGISDIEPKILALEKPKGFRV